MVIPQYLTLKLHSKATGNFKVNCHNDIQIGNKENVIEANSIQSAGYKSIISTLLTAGSYKVDILNR